MFEKILVFNTNSFKFQSFFFGLLRKIKAAGRADTDHHEEIPAASEEKIMDLLKTLQEIMEIEDKNTDEYRALVEKLPAAYRDNYHKLITRAMNYIFMSLLADRAREGIDLAL